MFPFLRLGKEFIKFRNAGKIAIDGTHISTHICWPVDIDIFGELNNGRTLTLYDLGRMIMGHRVGLIKVLKKNGWGLTMAGASVRYRRRVRLFDKVTMKSRAIGRDDKFIYMAQFTNRMRSWHVLFQIRGVGRLWITSSFRIGYLG